MRRGALSARQDARPEAGVLTDGQRISAATCNAGADSPGEPSSLGDLVVAITPATPEGTAASCGLTANRGS